MITLVLTQKMVKCYLQCSRYCSNARRIDANKDKKYSGFLPSSTYGITLGVNYKNFDFSVDGYGTLEQSVQW
jgi:hypothetical protein